MRKKAIKVIEFLWPVIVPILSAFLGLKAMNVYNLFEHLGFVEAENAFDLGVTVYFAVIDVLLTKLSSGIKEHFFSKQTLEVVLSLDRNCADVGSDINVSVNDNQPTSVNVTIRLDAKKSTCKDSQVKILAFGLATMQLPGRSNIASVDQNGNFIIDLSKFYNQQDHITVEQSFRVLMLKEPAVERGNIVIQPELFNESVFLEYKSNKMTVRTEE